MVVYVNIYIYIYIYIYVYLIGAVELEKLTLKKDALRKLKLPVEVKAGEVY